MELPCFIHSLSVFLTLLLLTLEPSVHASPLLLSPDPRVDFLPNQTLPQYALDHAPYVYLHSEEIFWPADISTHLNNVQPKIDFQVVDDFVSSGASCANFLKSSNLRDNVNDQEDIYLTATSPPYNTPMGSWFYGVGPPDHNGKSAAATIIIAMDKTQQVGPGWVDVFYLFFYSYNRGNYFYNNRFGDHVADWENTMIRFHNGIPMYIIPEAHGGQVMLGNSAFKVDVLEQMNNRPIVYSANGTHGMYPQAGQQNYTGLPVPVYDQTDKGHLLDPTLNYKAYYYSNEAGFTYTGTTPLAQQDLEQLGWLQFMGSWGDQRYNTSTPEQTCLGPMCFYDSGPLGPQSKSLSRGWLCGSSDCTPQVSLPAILQPNLSTTKAAKSMSIKVAPVVEIINLIIISSVLIIQWEQM